ncbi:MAG: MBL fold metallo-hydrolase, partial [Candidatus Aquicultor sp.]
MIIEELVVSYLDTNCYIVADENTKEAILIDPGGDEDQIIELIDKRGFNVEYIVLTHGHWDHVFGAQMVAKRTGAKVCIHGMDMFLLNDISFVPAYMHDELPEEKLTVDVELSDGQILSAGLI